MHRHRHLFTSIFECRKFLESALTALKCIWLIQLKHDASSNWKNCYNLSCLVLSHLWQKCELLLAMRPFHISSFNYYLCSAETAIHFRDKIVIRNSIMALMLELLFCVKHFLISTYIKLHLSLTFGLYISMVYHTDPLLQIVEILLVE